MAGIAGMGSPGKLNKPVPAEAQMDAFVPDLSELNLGTPQIANSPQPTEAPAEIDYEALAAESLAADAPTEADAIDYDAIAASAIAEEAPQSLGQQASDFGSELVARFKAGFGGDAKQKKKILEKMNGQGNVEISGDDLYVTKNGKKEKFTRGMLDMAGDLIGLVVPSIGALSEDNEAADLARDAADLGKVGISEAVALPFEIVGGLVGTGAAPGPGTAAGIAAGRLVGGAVGERAATAVGDLLGAEYKEGETEGEKLMRSGIVGGTRAVLGFGFDKLSNAIGQKAAARLAEREAKRALYLGEKAPGTPEEVAQRAVGAARETMEDVNALVDAGILRPVPGGEGAVLLPHQANTAVPEFAETASNAARGPEANQFRNFLVKQGETFAQAWQKVTKSADQLATTALTAASRLDPANASQTISAADRAWGGTIGQYKKEAISNAGDQTFAASRFGDALQDAAKLAGFQLRNDGTVDFSLRVRPDADSVAEKLSISKDQAQELINRLVVYGDKMFNTKKQLTLREMNEMYDFLARKSKDAFGKSDVSYSYRGIFNQLKNGIRDDFSESMGAERVLGEAKRAEFLLAKERFTAVKSAAEELSGLVDKDNMSAKAMAQYLFSNNKDSLDRIAALKPILEMENPGAWDRIVDDWMGSLTQQYAVVGDEGKLIGGINWAGLEKHLNGKPEIMKEVFGDRAKNIMALIRTGRQVQQGTAKSGLFSAKDAAQLANNMIGVAPVAAKDPMFLVRLLRGMGGPEASMREMLSRGGRNEILKRVSSGNRSKVARILDQVINDGVAVGVQKAGAPLGSAAGRALAPDGAETEE
jgi:hypothetical protein